MKRILRLKTAARAALLLLLIGGMGMTRAYAIDGYDFTDTFGGTTFYFKVVGANEVCVTYPETLSSSNPNTAWGSTTKPSGLLSIPTSVTYNSTTYTVVGIDDYCFYNCQGITGALVIPSSITTIGDRAFYGCSGLTSVSVGQKLTQMGYMAFSFCTSLTSVSYDVEECEYNRVTNTREWAYGAFFQSGVEGDCTLTIGSHVKNIPSCMFSFFTNAIGTNGSFTIPNNVETIGEYAFHSCTSIPTLTFGTGVSTIKTGAFYMCTGLATVNLHKNITTIEKNAFNGCTILANVYSPSTTPPTLGQTAFGDQLVSNKTSRTAHVPTCSVAAYEAFGWNNYFNPITGDLTSDDCGCTTPTVSVSYGSTSATLSWANTGATSYSLVYGPENGTQQSVSVSSASGTISQTLNGLNSNTTYTYSVTANCDGSSTSTPATGSFTTESSSVPCYSAYYEKVTSTSDITNDGRYILVYEGGAGTSPMVALTSLNSSTGNVAMGTNSSLSISNGRIDVATLPSSTAVLKVLNAGDGKYYLCYTDPTQNKDIYLFGDPSTGNTSWSQLQTMWYLDTNDGIIFYTNNNLYQQYMSSSLFLENKMENNVYLYKLVESVVAPTVTYTDLTTSSVKLEWDQCDGATSWDIYYTTNSADVPSAATNGTAVSSPYETLTNLSAGTTYYAYVRTKVGSATSVWSPVTFRTLAPQNVFTNAVSTSWEDGDNWSLGHVPTAEENVLISGDCIIPDGCIAVANEVEIDAAISGGIEGSLTIADGGQLVLNNEGVYGTLEKNIPLSEPENPKWYFISSPIMDEYSVYDVTAASASETSVYAFDQSYKLEWRYMSPDEDIIEHGRGYIISSIVANYYVPDPANPSVSTPYYKVTFFGQFNPSDEPYPVPLDYTTDEQNVGEGYDPENPQLAPQDFENLRGWNFVGNPFTCNAQIDMSYYRMVEGQFGHNSDYEIDPTVSTGAYISPCEAVFVVATTEGQKVTFSRASSSGGGTGGGTTGGRGVIVLSMEKAAERGTARVDKAIVSFNENDRLPKLILNPDNARLYIPQNGKDYAIAYSDKQGVLPVNFLPNENGSYTINVKTEEAEFSYLHLIDNMTGADVDLLANPTYSFESTLGDYPSRFKLVFSAGSAFDGEYGDNAPFAFYDGSEWILATDGNATVQLVDLMGRMLVSNKGAHTVSTNGMAPGMYVLRLIQGDNVKTQKIVVR